MPATILVVDDDPAMRAVVGDALRDAGYAVREAGNGLSALGAVETDPPDLVLSDVRMPLMDGLALAAHLARRRMPIPTLLMSADGTVPHGTHVPFLAKPFALEALLARVAQLLTIPVVCGFWLPVL